MHFNPTKLCLLPIHPSQAKLPWESLQEVKLPPPCQSTEATGHPPEAILETHLNKQKPSKQVFIGTGLPILPKRLIDKMTNGEYINFNELIPFCDPTAEEDSDWETTSKRFQLFPELGLIQPGHKLKYTFLQ